MLIFCSAVVGVRQGKDKDDLKVTLKTVLDSGGNVVMVAPLAHSPLLYVYV